MLNAGQDWRTSIYQSYCVFAPFFSKKNSAKQDIPSTEIAYQFLAPKVPVLRRNKATNPSTSTDPFSAATKTLVLGNLFKLVRSAITFARAVCIGGNEKNTRRLSYFPRLHLYPQVANFQCEGDEAKVWINYQVHWLLY